jgi:gamma-glutamyltranspeptidase / glutathione hydrolase / leukotriene-C4 hydrolase
MHGRHLGSGMAAIPKRLVLVGLHLALVCICLAVPLQQPLDASHHAASVNPLKSTLQFLSHVDDGFVTKVSARDIPSLSALDAEPAINDPANANANSTGAYPQAHVSCSNPVCTEIGLKVAHAGGSAVDIAIATSLCLGVVNAYASGLGGGGFMLVQPASSSSSGTTDDEPNTHGVVEIDCREVAPRAATPWMFLDRPEAMRHGGLATAVPGQLACYAMAHARYGRAPWESLFQGAIRLARDGFPLPLNTAHRLVHNEAAIRADAELARIYLRPDGALMRVGDVCQRPSYARTLWTLATQGPDALYRGKLGEALVRFLHARGGIMSVEDLADYAPVLRKPIAAVYHGMRVLTTTAHSGGPLLAAALNILEPLHLKGDDGERAHLVIEALKFAHAAHASLGDPAFAGNAFPLFSEPLSMGRASEDLDVTNVTQALARMLSPEWAKHVRAKITPDTTHDPRYYEQQFASQADEGTCHVSVLLVERLPSEGGTWREAHSAVSFTSSVNAPFGAMLMDPSTGILVNNQMADFASPQPEHPTAPHPNYVASHKRPRSSMCPVIVQQLEPHDVEVVGKVGHATASPPSIFMILGGSGGARIPSSVLQVLLQMVDQAREVVDAITYPRFYPIAEVPAGVEVEFEMDAGSRHTLSLKGHHLVRIPAGLPMQSLVSAIARHPGGEWVAATDPRIFSIGIGY